MIDLKENEIRSNWKNVNNVEVSISCISYNQVDYLSNAIESFLKQKTNFAFEILIHDDFSTDGTKELILEYQNKYPNIVYPIIQKENQFSKNIKPHYLNFKRARGRYLAMCDGDDFWIDNEKLQIQFDIMEKNYNLNICFHAVKIHNKIKNKSYDKILSNSVKIFSFNSVILKDHKIYTSTVSFMIRKKILEDLPAFCYNAPTEDYYLMILGSYPSGAIYIPRIMSVYNLYVPNSWTLKDKSSSHYFRNVISLLEVKNHYKYGFLSVFVLKIINFLIKGIILKFILFK